MSEIPKVSIVVLNWNRIEDTKLCLSYLRKLTYPNVEIIIVDNGSTDGSKEYLRKVKNIVLVDNEVNRGFTGGHIDGLRVSSGEYILLLNNDAVIGPDYIEKGLAEFSSVNVAAVGGRAYEWNSQKDILNESVRYFAYMNINPVTGESFFEQHDNGRAVEVNSVSGSAVLIRKSVIQELGYLYEPFFAYFEETDLFARFKRAGYKILYSPDLKIWHKGGASSNSYFQFNQLLKNRFIFATRNFETLALLRFYYIFLKIGAPCLYLRYKKDDLQVMHRAYANAFISSILHFPRWMFSRRRLERTIGKSNYNSLLRSEQTGISYVSSTKIAPRAPRQFAKDEYISVSSQTGDYKSKAVRTIKNKNQIATHPENIGWLCAVNDWVAFIRKGQNVSPSDHSTVQEYSKKSFFIDDETDVIYIRRDALQKIGGIPSEMRWEEWIVWLYAYFDQKTIPADVEGILTPKRIKELTESATARQKIDKASLKKPSGFDLFILKHHRAMNVVVFGRWLFASQVPLRLKLARTKNLLVTLSTLNKVAFRTELKHIRNEHTHAYGIGKFLAQQELGVRAAIKEMRDSIKNTPVFIICRDRVDSLRVLVNWLECNGFRNILFIDNDSIYPPLLKYFSDTPYQVFPTKLNVGHKSPWESGFVKTLVPSGFYVVTDPDVIPIEECPDDVLERFLDLHEEFFDYQKVGFGLKIDDLPKAYSLKDSVIEWESQFWANELAPDVYEAPLDTTFALYKPYNYQYFLMPSIRTGGSMMARHIPWYSTTSKPTDEDIFYKKRVDGEITSWNMDALPDRYIKEMRNK